MRRALRPLAAVFLMTAGAAAACSSETPATPSDPVLAQGQQVYRENCASCHGQTGGGGVGKKLAGTVEATYPNIDDHVAVVVEGKKGTNMPAFGERLTAEEIDAVVRYEREGL